MSAERHIVYAVNNLTVQRVYTRQEKWERKHEKFRTN